MKKDLSVVVFDYGFGNVRSVQKAFNEIGVSNCQISDDFDKCISADGLVIPGVGAFTSCMEGLRQHQGDKIIERRLSLNKPIFGICVGFQILFNQGEEGSVSQNDGIKYAKGLGLIKGDFKVINLFESSHIRQRLVIPAVVQKLDFDKLPHMGWAKPQYVLVADDKDTNSSSDKQTELNSGLMTDLVKNEYYYYVHSYGIKMKVDDHSSFISAVDSSLISGTQFHPEKSGESGLNLLRRWVSNL